MQEKATYKDAGVDIDNANLFLERLKPLVKSTFRKEVMSNIGGFGGLFHLDLAKVKDPVLVASTDGVGTKLKIARMMNKHDTIITGGKRGRWKLSRTRGSSAACFDASVGVHRWHNSSRCKTNNFTP